MKTGDEPSRGPQPITDQPSTASSLSSVLTLGRHAVASLSLSVLLRGCLTEKPTAPGSSSAVNSGIASRGGDGGGGGGDSSSEQLEGPSFFKALMASACGTVDAMLLLCTLRRRAE